MYKLTSFIIGCFISVISFCQSDSTLKEFAGKYTFPAGSVLSEVTIAYENGSLTINTVMGSSALAKKEGDVFIISQYNGTATFTRDTNKKVNGITIDALGYHLEGTKENSIALHNFSVKYIRYKNNIYII
jgi:hypothetical protein